MTFEIDGSRYQIVFEYLDIPTGKFRWIDPRERLYVNVMHNYPEAPVVRVQVGEPITRRTVTCRLLRDGQSFASGTIRMNPKLGNSKERLRVEALHKCMAQFDSSFELCRRIRAAMWRAYSERKMVLKTIYNQSGTAVGQGPQG